MSWPTYDNVADLPVRQVTRDIVRALRGHVSVELLVRNAEEQATARAFLGRPSHVSYRFSPNQEIWARDFGPIFLSGTTKSRRIVDFQFDFWGYRTPADPLARAETGTEALAARVRGLPLTRSWLVSEGGNREADGRGTLMMVEAVERRRNPGRSRAELEAEFRRVLGVRRFIWLDRGVAEDDLTFETPLANGAYTVVTTGGHVDNVARFVDSRTILISHVTEAEAKRSPVMAETRLRMLANERILRAARDPEGRRYRLVRMPSPEVVTRKLRPGDGVYDFIAELKYERGHVFPKGQPVPAVEAASYLNYFVSNGVVLVSRLYRPGLPIAARQKDAEAVRILRRAFPNRRIVALRTDAINLGGGGIHCITQQEPR